MYKATVSKIFSIRQRTMIAERQQAKKKSTMVAPFLASSLLGRVQEYSWAEKTLLGVWRGQGEKNLMGRV